MLSNSIGFISVNGNRIPSFENRIIFFQYLKNAIFSGGLMFLHEAHSTIHDEKKMEQRFSKKIIFLAWAKQVFPSCYWFNR